MNDLGTIVIRALREKYRVQGALRPEEGVVHQVKT